MLKSDSSELQGLKNFLNSKGIRFVSEIKANRTPPTDFALFISNDLIAERVGKGRTSKRQLKGIQNSVKKELGLQIEWIAIQNEDTGSIENALQILLNRKYPDVVRSVYVSPLTLKPVSVWIEMNSMEPSPPSSIDLKSDICEFLKLYEIHDPLVMDGFDMDLPSNPMLLRKIKILAPATGDELAASLKATSSTDLDIHWLQRKLDQLRKKGWVVRSKVGLYSLTDAALALVPHGTSKVSSDIDRALALAIRKW